MKSFFHSASFHNYKVLLQVFLFFIIIVIGCWCGLNKQTTNHTAGSVLFVSIDKDFVMKVTLINKVVIEKNGVLILERIFWNWRLTIKTTFNKQFLMTWLYFLLEYVTILWLYIGLLSVFIICDYMLSL